MSEFLSAVYEAGAFRPTLRPQLVEGQLVEILVRPRQLMKPEDVAAALAVAAAIPVTGSGDRMTGQHHDRAIYDEAHSS